MKKPGLPEWCATHSFREFLELIQEPAERNGWDAFSDAVKAEDEQVPKEKK
jgi:hypothetical protein